MAKSIPSLKIGNQVFEIKDLTARRHLIEVRNDQPTSEDNQLWIKEQEEEYQVPTYAEYTALLNDFRILKARVDRLDPQ